MIADIFKDNKLQKQFNEDGFIKIPLLSKNDIIELTRIFHDVHPKLDSNAFGASSFLTNKIEKIKIKELLYPIFLPYFEAIFNNYSYFGSSFLYKTKGINSDLAPHQDWTIVDERKYVAINIWIPLIDTHPKNGTLYVVPKTQAKYLFSLRAPTIPFYFQKYFSTVIDCAIPMNAKAGEAVILNQSLIHYSSPNLEDDLRIAITSGIKSKGAPMLFHYVNEHREIEQFEMPEDFLISFDNFQEHIYQRPNGKFIGKIEYQPKYISKLEFKLKFKNNGWYKYFNV